MADTLNPLTNVQRLLLRNGAAHRDGVVSPTGFRTNYEKGHANRAISALLERGLIVPNAHGDYYITDEGRGAIALAERAKP